MEAVKVKSIPLDALDTNEELLQTGFWARLKERFGWDPSSYAIEVGGVDCRLLLLSRRFGWGFQITYVPFGPCGPEPDEDREAFLEGIARGITSLDREKPSGSGRSFAVRFDLPWSARGGGLFPTALRHGHGLKKAPEDIQPASTVIVDIRSDEETILAAMKPKTRYNIRLAFKKGIEVREAGRDGLERWYDLYRHTAQRDRISIHSRDYYEAQFVLAEEYREKGLAYRLLLASKGDETLAGIIVVLWGKTARYLFGASSNRHRNLMPTYAVQWRAIQMAKEAGCERYDLFGIPASNDPHHPMHGLYQFKTGFGGAVVNRLGCWDVVLSGFRYTAYRKAEAARRFYHKVLKKRVSL